MADERIYDLASEQTTYDGDIEIVCDKSGFSRAKRYKISTLKSHIEGGLTEAIVSLTAGEVATLGTSPVQLLASPGSGKTYQIIDIKWYIDVATQLEAGTQNLDIYFDTVTRYLATIRNDQVESATDLIKGVQIQAEHELKADKQVLCKLSGSADPSSGSATMKFWIVYKEITL